MKNSKLLEIDFAEFLGLDLVMTPVEIDELTEKLNDEIFSRGIDSALTVKKEFIIEYLHNLLDDYGGRKYEGPRKIEMQFEMVRNLREILDIIQKESFEAKPVKEKIEKVNKLVIKINSPLPVL